MTARLDAEAVGLPTASGMVLGRSGELARLGELIRRARAGKGGIAWLLGPSGIGKSTMTAWALAQARALRMQTLSASAAELYRHRPLTVVAEALGVGSGARERRRRELARLLAPEPGSLLQPGGELELGLREALIALLEDCCASQPAVLALDDLQWSDPASLEFLGRLATSIGELPLAVVGAARPRPRPRELERLIALTLERGALALELGALTAAEVDQLAAALAGAPAGPRLRELLGRCGGNPLFVRYLLEALDREGKLRRGPAGEVEAAAHAIPTSLHAAALMRLDALGEETLELLRLAAVLGQAFTAEELALVSGRASRGLWPALREALDAGALVDEGARLGFAHEVVREALYLEIPASIRVGLHREFGRALASAGAEPVLVAEHIRHSLRRGDREAVAWLERAARVLAPRAAGSAAELLELALGALAPGDHERDRLRSELAVQLVRAGERERGEELCRALLAERGAPPAEGMLRMTLARSLFERGRPSEALGELARLAALPSCAADERSLALGWLGHAALLDHDLDAARARTLEALALARRARSPRCLAFACSELALIAELAGDCSAALELARAALTAARRDGSDDAHRLSHAHLKFALALADCDRASEGVAQIAAGRRVYERLGMEETLRNSHHYAGYPLMLTAHWDEALAEGQTALALSERYQLSWVVDVLALMATVHARRGELERAEELVQRGEQQLEMGAPQFRFGWTRWARALIEEAAGRPLDACERLWGVFCEASQRGLGAEQRAFAPDLLRLLAAERERDRLAVVAEAIGRLAERNPRVGSLRALAARSRATHDDDPSGLAAACALYPPSANACERALAHEDAAVALARVGSRAQAREHAERALTAYAALAADAMADRLAARLRAAGIRRGVRGRRRRPGRGWQSLTPTECRIAELAAMGLSNPQIAARLVISRHTVATHIRHILAKLELRSRYELASARHNARGGPGPAMPSPPAQAPGLLSRPRSQQGPGEGAPGVKPRSTGADQ